MRQPFLFLLILIAGVASGQQEQAYHQSLTLMGCRFDLTVVAPDQASGAVSFKMAIAEIQRIERLISSWDPNSETSRINQMAGKAPVKVSPELFQLIARSVGLAKLTDGAFDLTYASLDRVWRFDGSMTKLPEAAAVKASVAKVGFAQLVLDESTSSVFLPREGMKIGFGAIGKGYAADRARQLLEQAGVSGGIISASGDLTAWGQQPDGTEWTVAITNPLNQQKAFAWLPLDGRAVVTSGNYEKFVRFEGVRYAHIIDPRTGYPARGLLSVTVFAPKAELADALATAVFVMGMETGLNFINQLPGIDAILVDEGNHLHYSTGLDLQQTTAND